MQEGLKGFQIFIKKAKSRDCRGVVFGFGNVRSAQIADIRGAEMFSDLFKKAQSIDCRGVLFDFGERAHRPKTQMQEGFSFVSGVLFGFGERASGQNRRCKRG